MEKRKKSISINIPPVRLFLEDIKEIETIYKENFETFKIQTLDFELDSTEELESIEKDKLSYISFKSSNPNIEVELTPSNAKIYSCDDDVKYYGIVTKLKNILNKRTSPLRHVFKDWILFFFISLPIIIYKYFPEPKKHEVLFPICAVASMMIIIVYGALGYYFVNKKHSVIYLTNRSSQKNIISRNKYKIILAGISAIFASVVTLLIMYFTGLFNLKN